MRRDRVAEARAGVPLPASSHARRLVATLAWALMACASPERRDEPPATRVRESRRDARHETRHEAHEVRIPVVSRDASPSAADGRADTVWLAGTLSIPAGADRRPRAMVPAVLVVGGSGPQDRDGARPDLPGYRPWQALSDTLVARGIAVLRLDDRGTGGSGGRFAGATTIDFAGDASAALAWLRRHPGIAPDRVALVGHSEGAVVALLVARADPAVAALALLGAPSRSGRELARWQRQALVGSDLATFPPEARASVLARADAEAEALARADPWLRTWFALDPRVIARDVRCPVLLLHGTTDRQVPPVQAAELAQALRAAGAPVELVRMARTDHLLLTDDDGEPAGYVRLATRTVRTEVLATVAAFLARVLALD